MIQVFNRSHYEDILVPTVYGLLNKKEIEKRYTMINKFEELIESNGTTILKFFLHTSKDKQYKCLMERVEIKEKHWKHNDGDWETREHWNEFMGVYETIFERCNAIPWHIIPCDHNWTKLYSTAQVLIEELKKMDPQFPGLDTEKFTPDYSKSKYRY